MPLGPLRVTPRLDAKPWGGARLAGLGFAVEGQEPLGEVVMTATGNRVAGGPHDGTTLGELIGADAVAMIGWRGLAATGGRALFPLLVKLIDAAEPLSIQVHPDDGRAAATDALGKTEAWHILAVEPGAGYYAGLVDGAGVDDLERAVREAPGTVAGLVREVAARAGETVLFPAGTLHALGAGVMVYELQQASEITYRLDDWGRVGSDGRPRTMHVAESLEAVDPSLRPEVIPPVRLLGGEVERDVLVACHHFALDRFRIAASRSAVLEARDTAQTVTVVGGAVELRASGPAGVRFRVGVGETVVVPAVVASVEVRAVEPATVLRAWVPDLQEDIVAPALAVGCGRGALAALSAPIDDVPAAFRRLERPSPSRPSPSPGAEPPG